MVTTGDLVFRLTLPGIWCLQATENDMFFFLNMYRLGLFICLLTQVLIHSEFYDHEGFFLNLRTAQVGQNSLETENSLIEMCNLRFEVAATKCLTHDKIQKNTLGCRCIGECT